jgi:nucleotide-binding universal stress UspA family protein
MKTILFPTDFSKASVQSVPIAVIFARLLSARIVFLYAVRSFADRDKFIGSAAFEDETQAKQALTNLAEKYSGEIPCESQVRTGVISDEIAAAAKDSGASLVIMTTSGAGEVPDALALLNSTTADLISKRICPVLALPAGVSMPSIRKIVLAIDREPVDAIVLTLVTEIAQQPAVEVLLLTVHSDEEISGDDLLANKNTAIEQALPGATYSVHAIRSDDTIESIRKFAADQQADIITVISRKQSFFNMFFHESVSQKLTLHSQLPLLVLPG